jgi:hypothetical protein
VLRGSQTLRSDNADSEGVSRLENANPWRVTNELATPPKLRQRTEEYNLREVDELAQRGYKKTRENRGENLSIDNFGSCGRRLSPR